MAFTPYHNLLGATTRDNELVAINDTKHGIKSLQISNVKSDAAATVDLYIFKDSTDTAASQVVYILNQVVIPFGVSLFLNEDEVHFDNSIWSLYMNVGGSDTVDVLIKKKQSKS
jgi:dynactin complex subunit